MGTEHINSEVMMWNRYKIKLNPRKNTLVLAAESTWVDH